MVMPLDKIEKYVDAGDFPAAYAALEELLELGPKNTHALRLKAMLFGYEGRFREESKLWQKIITLDPEDEFAIAYFRRSMQEERENEYFTDLLPSGGIRFLVTPKAIIHTSFFGLMGCALFLTLANFSHRYPFLATPWVSFAFFSVLVILPWLFIVSAYIRSVKEIVIDREAIHVRTRTKDYQLSWAAVDGVILAHRLPPVSASALSLLLVPKDPEQVPFEINISQNSFIRAPSFFVREVVRVFQEPKYATWNHLKLPKKPKFFS